MVELNVDRTTFMRIGICTLLVAVTATITGLAVHYGAAEDTDENGSK